MEDLRIKFAIVFRAKDLEYDFVKNELYKYGKIFDEERTEDLMIFYIESDYSEFLRCKRELHAIEDPEQRYILYPMLNERAKLKAILNYGAI